MSQWGKVRAVRREVWLTGVGATLVEARVLPHYDGPAFTGGSYRETPDSYLVTSLVGVHRELSFTLRQEAAELIRQMMEEES